MLILSFISSFYVFVCCKTQTKDSEYKSTVNHGLNFVVLLLLLKKTFNAQKVTEMLISCMVHQLAGDSIGINPGVVTPKIWVGGCKILLCCHFSTFLA